MDERMLKVLGQELKEIKKELQDIRSILEHEMNKKPPEIFIGDKSLDELMDESIDQS